MVRSAAAAAAAAVDGAEAEHDGGNHDRDDAENYLADCLAVRTVEFAEQESAPEKTDEGIGIPEGEGDREPDVADGENSQGVSDCP